MVDIYRKPGLRKCKVRLGKILSLLYFLPHLFVLAYSELWQRAESECYVCKSKCCGVLLKGCVLLGHDKIVKNSSGARTHAGTHARTHARVLIFSSKVFLESMSFI